jgi:hypothetical protein
VIRDKTNIESSRQSISGGEPQMGTITIVQAKRLRLVTHLGYGFVRARCNWSAMRVK